MIVELLLGVLGAITWAAIRFDPIGVLRGVAFAAIWLFVGLRMLTGCLEQPEPELYTCTIVYRCATDPTPSAAIGFACATDDDEANERITSASWAVIAARCDIKALQYVRPLCSAYKPSEACEE